MKIDFNPFPELETERLFLRKLKEEEDMYDVFNMRKDPSMHEYTDTRPDEKLEDSIDYIRRMNQGVDENKWIVWGLQDKGSDRIIGTISIWNIYPDEEKAELGFGIVPEFRGRGIMTEGLREVVDYSFREANFKKLEAFTEEGNSKSISVLQRCGFIEDRRVIDQSPFDGKEYKMVVYKRTHPNLLD